MVQVISKKKKEDEDRKARIAAGNADIRAREQERSKVAAGQVPTRAEKEQAGKNLRAEGELPRQVTMKEALEEKERKKEAVQVAEESGVFEDRPVRTELDVTEGEKRTLEIREDQEGKLLRTEKWLGVDREESSKILGIDQGNMEIEDLIKNPETARQILLQEIQREELNKFKTFSQKVGSSLEPWVGDLKVIDIDVGGYADKFTRMPKQEVTEIVQAMKEAESIVSGMTDSAAQGEIGNPNEVMRDIADYEEDIYRLEARLKVLILSSTELRANPEAVNEIEVSIMSAKETIFEAKQRAGEGALITPTNEQLYFKLKREREANQ